MGNFTFGLEIFIDIFFTCWNKTIYNYCQLNPVKMQQYGDMNGKSQNATGFTF